MSNKPLISIVVPARNEEKYLGRCLKALSKQDYPNFEIVVIDNGSEDKTSDIAKKFTPYVFKEEILGVSYARKEGFRRSRGLIIARTDADSVPPREWLSRLHKAFQEDPNIIAVTGSDEFFDRGLVIRFLSRFSFWALFYLTRLFFGHYQLSGPNFAVKKKALENVSFHMDDGKIHEDMDIACHIEKKGKIVFIPSLIMPISGRKLKSDPGHLFKYFKKSFHTYFLHHPSHKLHSV